MAVASPNQDRSSSETSLALSLQLQLQLRVRVRVRMHLHLPRSPTYPSLHYYVFPLRPAPLYTATCVLVSTVW